MIRTRRHMSDAETTTSTAVATTVAEVAKGKSWETVFKDALPYGGLFVGTASLLLALSLHIETTITRGVNATIEQYSGEMNTKIADYSGEINTKIEKLSGDMNSKIDKLSGDMNTKIEKLSGDMNTKIEKLSSETKASNVEMNMNIQMLLAKTNSLLAIMEKQERQP